MSPVKRAGKVYEILPRQKSILHRFVDTKSVKNRKR